MDKPDKPKAADPKSYPPLRRLPKVKAVMMSHDEFRRKFGGGRIVVQSHRNGGKPWRR